MKKIATTLLALTLAALAAGCNTVQGVGQDIEKAGGAIKRAAQYTRTPRAPKRCARAAAFAEEGLLPLVCSQ